MPLATYLCLAYSEKRECVPHLVNADNPHSAADSARNDLMLPPFGWKAPFTIVVCTRSSPTVMRTPWLPVAISHVQDGNQTSELIGIYPASVLGWDY